MFGFLGKIFKPILSVLEVAWNFVKAAGLNDEVIELALKLVKTADMKFIDNIERREWVVSVLRKRGLPEGVARIAVEFAYRIYKAKKAKVDL